MNFQTIFLFLISYLKFSFNTHHIYLNEDHKKHISNYFHFRLVCRCLERLNRLSEGNLTIYNQFTIENYGECWSRKYGYDSLDTFKTSDLCIGEEFDKCDSNMPECCGTNLASFLYQVHNRTKLLDEHCYIMKRIVCPSSVIIHNSSTPIHLVGNSTVFISATTDSPQHTASKVLQNSTVLLNTVTQKAFTSSSLQNHTNATITSQYSTSQMGQNPTISISDAISISQTYMPSLMRQSNSTKPNSQSTSKNYSSGTDSMLSQLQTLNTSGKLYTSGSQLPNVTQAPTLFFVGSLKLYTKAKTKLPKVESTYHYSKNSNSLASAKSSSTTVLQTTISAERLTSSLIEYSVSAETTLQTSRLNYALSSINTSPIKATSTSTASTFSQQTASTLSQSLLSSLNLTQNKQTSTAKSPQPVGSSTLSKQSTSSSYGNYSSIEREISSTAMSMNVTIVGSSRLALNKSSCEPVLNKSCQLNSTYSTTSFNIKPTSVNVYLSLLTEDTTVHLTNSGSIKRTHEASTSIRKENSTSHFKSASLKGHLSSKLKGTTSTIVQTKSNKIEASSETMLSRSTKTTPNTLNSKNVHTPKGNSAESQPTTIMITLVLPGIMIINIVY